MIAKTKNLMNLLFLLLIVLWSYPRIYVVRCEETRELLTLNDDLVYGTQVERIADEDAEPVEYFKHKQHAIFLAEVIEYHLRYLASDRLGLIRRLLCS